MYPYDGYQQPSHPVSQPKLYPDEALRPYYPASPSAPHSSAPAWSSSYVPPQSPIGGGIGEVARRQLAAYPAGMPMGASPGMHAFPPASPTYYPSPAGFTGTPASFGPSHLVSSYGLSSSTFSAAAAGPSIPSDFREIEVYRLEYRLLQDRIVLLLGQIRANVESNWISIVGLVSRQPASAKRSEDCLGRLMQIEESLKTYRDLPLAKQRCQKAINVLVSLLSALLRNTGGTLEDLLNVAPVAAQSREVPLASTTAVPSARPPANPARQQATGGFRLVIEAGQVPHTRTDVPTFEPPMYTDPVKPPASSSPVEPPASSDSDEPPASSCTIV